MTILHFLPEIALAIGIFSSLVLLGFRMLSGNALTVASASALSGVMLYFFIRTDLHTFDSPLALLRGDSFAFFVRFSALLSAAVFSMSYFFNRELSVEEKQNSTLFMLFQAFFFCGLALSQSLILFLICSAGIYFCSMNLILIESRQSPEWVSLFRKKAPLFGLWVMVVVLAFALSIHLFQSTSVGDWAEALNRTSEPGPSLIAFAALVMLAGFLPLAGLRHPARAPIGLGILCYGTLLVGAAFWFRAGIPFFTASRVIPKGSAQLLLSLVLGGISLKRVVSAIRTRESTPWLAALFPALTGVGFFTIVLPGEQALSAFYLVSLSLLFTFSLLSQAFQEDSGRFKGLLLVALVSILGAPPFILGEQTYRMVREAIEGGALGAGVLLILLWFGITIASMQIIGKILLNRVSRGQVRKPHAGEVFFFGLYLVAVIALTAFREPLVALLNEHPPLNLW